MPWHFSFFFLILYLCKHYPVKNRTSSVPQSSWYVPSWWNLTALTKLWAITTLQAFEAIISFVFMIVLKTKCASLDKALLDLNLSINGKLKSRDITLPTKVRLVKAMVFPVVIYGCESWTIKESWVPKNWCFWTVVLEKTIESPLDCKEIQAVHSKGDQPWDFFGRNDAEAETPVLWPPDAKSWLIGKDSDAGRDWGQEQKGMTEDEMAGWHH